MLKAEQVAEFFIKLQEAINKTEFERTPQEKKWIEKIKAYNEQIQEAERREYVEDDGLPF